MTPKPTLAEMERTLAHAKEQYDFYNCLDNCFDPPWTEIEAVFDHAGPLLERVRELRAALVDVVAWIRLQNPGCTMDGSHISPKYRQLLERVAAVLVRYPEGDQKGGA